MSAREECNISESQFDTKLNRTRGIESISFRETLEKVRIDSCLDVASVAG